MADLTLTDAAQRYLASVKDAARGPANAELHRFVRWYGQDRPLGQLRGHEVSLYADVLGPAGPDSSRRADYVRAFLVYLKKEGLTASNLGTHLRLRKSGAKGTAGAGRPAPTSVELTSEGIEALKAELETLVGQRMAVREEIRKAMLDKDFRENAPLDAAKDKQGHLEARIREIEAMLKRAVVVDRPKGDRIHVGATVHVRNLKSGTVNRFVIVGPTEANAADGKISSASPVGRSLLQRTVGDEVEVAAPAGTMHFRVEQIGD
jgi:transcription elongation factor GreA